MQRHLREFMIYLAAVVLFLIGGLTLSAQNTNSGALAGTVTDPTGAVLPGARVTVTNQGTHQVSTATTGKSGSYAVENLPDGDYTVVVAGAGFAKAQVTDIHLDPGQRRGQDVKLSVGAADSQVSVMANAISVQTESPESGGTISAKEVANLMLNGRNFQQLATLVPGVSSSTGQLSRSTPATSARPTSSSAAPPRRDHLHHRRRLQHDAHLPHQRINITPSIDAINELRILKNSYSAKYGFAGSGQVLIDTKSGRQPVPRLRL